MAFDAEGNLYFTDFVNCRIRKIDTSGAIASIAGESFCSTDGDGGPALEARLACADGLALDAQGNLHFTEFGGNRIRRIDTDGVVTTIAGTGEAGYTGDGGPATEATLNTPHGIAVDAESTIYFSDVGNFVVRMIDPDGIITTVAGTGQEGFAGDGGAAGETQLGDVIGIALAPSGDLCLTDSTNFRVRLVAISELGA